MSTPAANLTSEQLEAFGQELDAIRAGVVANLGQRDADYITQVIRAQRGLEVVQRDAVLEEDREQRRVERVAEVVGVPRLVLGHA